MAFWETIIYSDKVSGQKEQRPDLENCLKALRESDSLVVCKLDRLGRSLKHLVNTIQDLTTRKIGFKVLAALAEFETELISEGTKAGLAAAKIAMKNKETFISELCQELGGITKQTLYR